MPQDKPFEGLLTNVWAALLLLCGDERWQAFAARFLRAILLVCSYLVYLSTLLLKIKKMGGVKKKVGSSPLFYKHYY